MRPYGHTVLRSYGESDQGQDPLEEPGAAGTRDKERRSRGRAAQPLTEPPACQPTKPVTPRAKVRPEDGTRTQYPRRAGPGRTSVRWRRAYFTKRTTTPTPISARSG